MFAPPHLATRETILAAKLPECKTPHRTQKVGSYPSVSRFAMGAATSPFHISVYSNADTPDELRMLGSAALLSRHEMWSVCPLAAAWNNGVLPFH